MDLAVHFVTKIRIGLATLDKGKPNEFDVLRLRVTSEYPGVVGEREDAITLFGGGRTVPAITQTEGEEMPMFDVQSLKDILANNTVMQDALQAIVDGAGPAGDVAREALGKLA